MSTCNKAALMAQLVRQWELWQFPFSALWASCSTDQHLQPGCTYWGWGFSVTLVPSGSPVTCSRDRGAHKGLGWVLLEEYPSSGNRKVWFLWALGPPGALFPAGTGIRVSAFVHLFLTLAGAKQKSHRFLEWEPASSFPARNLNSHLLVHSSEKAQQQQQQDFNSQTAFGCLRCLFYFFGVCFYLKRKCMVNYSYR